MSSRGCTSRNRPVDMGRHILRVSSFIKFMTTRPGRDRSFVPVMIYTAVYLYSVCHAMTRGLNPWSEHYKTRYNYPPEYHIPDMRRHWWNVVFIIHVVRP